MFLAVLSAAYREEKLENGEERVVLRIPPVLAPVNDIIDDLKFDFNCQYDEKDSIGKRYRRQDAIGTPFCITVDHQTKEDNCVTIRDRDTMSQERIPVAEVGRIIRERTDFRTVMKKLNKIG